MIQQLVLPLPARDWRQDAALRPQPRRDGPDNWTTPRCLCATLTHDILPLMPAGNVWEPGPGSGALVDAITAAGRGAVTTLDDFLRCSPPKDARVLATNPPFNQHSAFTARCMALLEAGEVDGVILLFRHDHLQSESRPHPHCRIAALKRASAIYICRWRPVWIAGSAGNGRWSNAWVVWLRGHSGPPVAYWPDRRRR